MKTIGRDGLRDFLLPEVLGEASYNRGHLPGAVRHEGRERVMDLAPDRGAGIFARCPGPN